MKVIAVCLVVFSHLAVADNPYEKFDVTHNLTNSTTISWKQVSNVQQSCEQESHRRGLGGFGYSVDACSFWTNGLTSNCLVITAKKTDLETLGHEIRHCFQGSYHK